MSFLIFLGESPYDGGLTVNSVGEVGRIALPDGSMVWVLADEIDSTTEESALQSMRTQAARATAKSPILPGVVIGVWAMAEENTTGRPVIYDLGDPWFQPLRRVWATTSAMMPSPTATEPTRNVYIGFTRVAHEHP